MHTLERAIAAVDAAANNPNEGLPEPVFLMVSRLTPMVNVDLLIQNPTDGTTLLTWRNDRFHGEGWHIPGGIVRFKETFAERIHQVARQELGAKVRFDPQPLMIQEPIVRDRADRSHFVSLLFACSLTHQPDESMRFFNGQPQAGQWAWHKGCPGNVLPIHRLMYRHVLESKTIGNCSRPFQERLGYESLCQGFAPNPTRTPSWTCQGASPLDPDSLPGAE
ncbi:MAG: NUDIX hydrolase [Magnetococcales bacterium]|nr:NUDIX hydrolase [Magnetococcales bacterium]MBF0321896.1 NUDIX hydrolase [Magnetococcales bacterium]